MAKRKPEEPPKGAPAWQSTFADLMNLLLCFFVMLFSMSSVDAQKFELLAASFNQTFSIFSAGATAIGDGVLISNGVSQLNELDQYINSTGREAEGKLIPENLESAAEIMEEAKLQESEELAEKIEEALEEKKLDKEVDIEFTAQYVQLTLNGALLFDSGSVEIKEEALQLMNQLGIILQRLTEILSGIPWIVLMTLIILLMGSNFWTFALALCLTGWIGTSNLTRTQFYRFKGREYILASRTLGSKDGRLIFKHILPNSMGTIITSSVLMIPSVIFNEATISYLGLGLKNMNSLGIILSDNQANLMYYPYTLIVPAVVIALLMICFNLFGNGLRDAFNPSLKGSD